MKRFLLDTNTVSHLLKGHPQVTQRLVSVPMASLCISAITEGELLFGLAKRPYAKHLHNLVYAFLKRVEVLPWDSEAAAEYGRTRAYLNQAGKSLAPLDMLIAAQALAAKAILVTNDQAFRQLNQLEIEDWTQ